MDDMSITAEQIKAGRERLRMTQQQLADEVGVSLRTVSSWERGESIPRNRTAAVIEVLGLVDEESVPEFGQAALRARIGQLAKQRREELGIGRVAFAKEIGIGSDASVRDFEFGRRIPFGTTQRKLEKGLGWRLGAIDDVMRMKDRKASSIEMEEIDAEDSLHLAAQGGIKSLALVSDDELLAEVRRRMEMSRPRHLTKQTQDLFGLAASTNTEHLEEDEDGVGDHE